MCIVSALSIMTGTLSVHHYVHCEPVFVFFFFLMLQQCCDRVFTLQHVWSLQLLDRLHTVFTARLMKTG